MARNPSTNAAGGTFDAATIEAVWKKGREIAGFSTLRKDQCGAVIRHPDYPQPTEYGWEIDHIKPVAAGGGDELHNLQPLQWENNRHKGDDWPNWTCKKKT